MTDRDRGIFGGGLTFRDLPVGTVFHFALYAHLPDSTALLKTAPGKYRYLDKPTSFITGAKVPVVLKGDA